MGKQKLFYQKYSRKEILAPKVCGGESNQKLLFKFGDIMKTDSALPKKNKGNLTSTLRAHILFYLIQWGKYWG